MDTVRYYINSFVMFNYSQKYLIKHNNMYSYLPQDICVTVTFCGFYRIV